MKITKYDSREDWLADRPGKITGSKLKDIITKRGNATKIGVYQLVADKLVLKDDTVDGRDRGNNLEQECIEALSTATEIDFIYDLVMWESEDNESMAYSPDAYTKDYVITAEAKCLGSARHIEIIDTNKIPAEYYDQMLQSFAVNKKQRLHYFASYDPRIVVRPLHYIITKRDDVEKQVQFVLDYQAAILKKVDEMVDRIAF